MGRCCYLCCSEYCVPKVHCFAATRETKCSERKDGSFVAGENANVLRCGVGCADLGTPGGRPYARESHDTLDLCGRILLPGRRYLHLDAR
jgi:hypothetical protein